MPDRTSSSQRWIVVADSPFIPAHCGGDLENLGFVRAAHDAGMLAALVVPSDADPTTKGRQDDLAAIRRLVDPVPVYFTPRRRSLLAAVQGRRPYPVASRPTPAGLARDIRAAAPEATGVVAFSYRSHQLAGELARALGLPGVVRLHNMEGRYFHALAAARRPPTRWAVHAEAVRIDGDERRLERAPWVTGIADISRVDAQERQLRTPTPVRHVPTFVLGGSQLDLDRPWQPDPQPSVLFLGALDVPTNHEALTWFCREVWPSVHAACPEATLRIVGRHPTAPVPNLVATTPAAELHADVPDPGVYMRHSSVAVNPAVSGSGVNIKLVEYLASGVPVVSTSLGVQGLSLRADEQVLVRDDPASFAAAVGACLTDPALALRLSTGGREAARELSDTTRGLQLMAELFAGSPATPR
ncbi:MAG: glycosyltransferase family 4 protein [Austwickia sp.]|nr:glycosyltransferase family 4 protein [Actinomycetota bacterium]MCB1251879.1 glycosyltransferase [Austwickia sp.]MCO5310321.1 glycosyltransferase family 4 protein [Austwickia sp.]